MQIYNETTCGLERILALLSYPARCFPKLLLTGRGILFGFFA